MKLTEKSSLSSDKTSFDQAAPPCQKVPDECGYCYTLHLHYEPPTTNTKKQTTEQYTPSGMKV